MVPTLFGLVMLLAWPFISGTGIVWLAVVSTLFGGTAAAFAMGGATIVPSMFGQLFLGVNVLKREGLKGLLETIRFGSATFWLGLLALWGGASAVVLPRLFKGQFMVASYDRDQEYTSFLSPIQPTSMNITQSLYVFMALVTFILVRIVLKRPGAVALMFKSVIALASLNVLAAVIELAQYHLGMPPVLIYLKNANYVMLGGEVGGLMRITGTFPETSVFSVFTITLLAFLLTMWTKGIHARWAGLLSMISFALLMLSSSGTAYVTLGICAGVMVTLSLLHLARFGQLGAYRLTTWMLMGALVVGVGMLLFVPGAAEATWHLFETAIGKKMTSDSGTIRSALNNQAFQTFVDTFGIGAGLGSVRASSFALVVLSNLGWVGTVLLLVFLRQTLRQTHASALPRDTAILSLCARNALLVNLLAVTLIGLVFDLGTLFYILAAASSLAAAEPSTVKTESTPDHLPA